MIVTPRGPTRAAIVPRRRIPIIHLDTTAVLTPTTRVVSQPARIEATRRSTAESHRSKAAPSAPKARIEPTIASPATARAIQTRPLTPSWRGSGGGSPEGRRRLPAPRGPRWGVTLRLREASAASVAMADATATHQARDRPTGPHPEFDS